MTITRFSVPAHPARAVPSGYGGIQGAPSGLTIPSCDIEDVDAAVYEAFDTGIGLQVTAAEDTAQRPKVVFATGERWAVIKRMKGVRDKAGSLILPMITITRTAVVQEASVDVTGRGINQQTGEIVVSRRYDSTDRGQQALSNRLFLRNQQNVAVPADKAALGQLSTQGEVGTMSMDGDVVRGALLVPPGRRGRAVETITMPSPQFITATYEMTFWTQYQSHMNELWSRMTSAQLQQGNAIVLTTAKGYWFVSTIEGNSYAPDNNFKDMSESERVVKYGFTLKVPAYQLAGAAPGAPVPVKRTVSVPVVSFSTEADAGESLQGEQVIDDPYLGADDPTLPLDVERTRRGDGRRTGAGLLAGRYTVSPSDPAMLKTRRGSAPARYVARRAIDPVTGLASVQHLRVTSSNPGAGETVYASSPSGGLDGLVVEVGDA